MKAFAKLVYQTYASYLPTSFSAHYYGMPNGKIYLVFSRFYKAAFGQSGLEFVFAEHNDFSFDYEKETIVPYENKNKQSRIFAEHVDNPNSKFNILSISRKLKSYGEAETFLNGKAQQMRQSTKKKTGIISRLQS